MLGIDSGSRKGKKNIPRDFFPAATADDEIREKTNKIRVSCIRSVTVSRRGRRGRLLGSMPVDNLGIVLGGCWKKDVAAAINGDSREVAKARDVQCIAGE